MLNSHTLSVPIDCPPQRVYAFASNPENLPKWIPSFCKSVRKAENGWVLETPSGPLGIRFVAENEWGILDHEVTLQNGQTVFNPMRVVANGTGSEVLFTLFQTDGMSDVQFALDRGMVESDLRALKNILEQ